MPADAPLYDVIIVGGGPAGAVCAAACAGAGLRVLVLERARFPRPKVCGDCLNPDCWPVLGRLGAAAGVRALPHVALAAVEFVSDRGGRVRLPLPGHRNGERTVKRDALDAHLLAHAAARGAEVREETAVTRLGRGEGRGFVVEWTGGGTARGRFLVAADGRNSLVARWAGLLPKAAAVESGAAPRRIGLQTHVPRELCPPEFTAGGGLVRMQWLPGGGYVGLAPEGDGELNVSISAEPGRLEALKTWAREEFGLPADWPHWHTIAPLDRATARPAGAGGVFLVGDAARVVEPFTGEGIYYALRSGELAAAALVGAARGEQTAAGAARAYARAHRGMYRQRGRGWVNRLARAAALHPRFAAAAIGAARWWPGLLRFLTAKVVVPPGAGAEKNFGLRNRTAT